MHRCSLRSHDSTFDRWLILCSRVTIPSEPGASSSLSNNNWVCSDLADSEKQQRCIYWSLITQRPLHLLVRCTDLWEEHITVKYLDVKWKNPPHHIFSWTGSITDECCNIFLLGSAHKWQRQVIGIKNTVPYKYVIQVNKEPRMIIEKEHWHKIWRTGPDSASIHAICRTFVITPSAPASSFPTISDKN